LNEFIFFLKAHWQDVKDFSNSAFFTAITGSLAGAFFGAYGAQRIAEKAKNKEELLKEIRDTNATIAIGFGVCNSFLSIKKQHVKPFKEKFDSQKSALHDFQRKRERGEISSEVRFEFQADFQTLSPMPLPIDSLQRQLFEKLSTVGRPLGLATTLAQTAHELNSLLEKRNQLIEAFKANLNKEQERLPFLYFGLPYAQGHIDQNYPDTITGIYDQTDNGIFFSQLFCKDLVEHGEHLAKLFAKKFGNGAPKISKPDFTKAEAAGLMPSADKYGDWLSGFAKHPSTKKNSNKIVMLILAPFRRLSQAKNQSLEA
jgi:hypothetical protein